MINQRKKKKTKSATKTCSKSVKPNKSKGLLSFAVTFFLTVNSFFGW